MKEIVLTLAATEPLVITDGSAESMSHATLTWIPGNMLLGALASIWAARHPDLVPDDSEEFQRLFLRDEVYYGHAYLDAGVPVPMTYLRVKNRPGLPRKNAKANVDRQEDRFFICNSLRLGDDATIESLYFGKTSEQSPDQILKTKRLPAGFMNGQTYIQPEDRRVWNIHVALGDKRCGLDGQLFGFSAIAEGARFQSRILCNTEAAARDLASLLDQTPSLWVGHGRSAGYGRVSVEKTAPAALPEGEKIKADTFVLFLDSQYLPWPSWENPIENLLKAIARRCGAEPKIERQYASFGHIDGFNNMWRKPRFARAAIAMGSVFKITFPTEVELDSSLLLGGFLNEGYGRIMVNPPFLADIIGFITPPATPKTDQAPQANLKMTPTLRLLRERAINREAEAQAAAWLHDDRWQKFLKSVQRGDKTSPTQRNNLRSMTIDQFTQMLKKTPGEQWKETVAYSPFAGHNEELSVIMLQLLDRPQFLKDFTPSQLDLPGPAPDAKERKKFEDLACKLFILLLVDFWNKPAREGKK